MLSGQTRKRTAYKKIALRLMKVGYLLEKLISKDK